MSRDAQGSPYRAASLPESPPPAAREIVYPPPPRYGHFAARYAIARYGLTAIGAGLITATAHPLFGLMVAALVGARDVMIAARGRTHFARLWVEDGQLTRHAPRARQSTMSRRRSRADRRCNARGIRRRCQVRQGDMMKKSAMLALVLVAAPLVVGCSKKGPECEQLVKTVNANASSSNAPAGEDPAAKLETEAKADDQTASSLDGQTYTVAELKQFATQYSTMCKDEAQNNRAVAVAFKSIDSTGAADLAAATAYPDAMKKVADACSHPSDEDAKHCTAFLEKMKELPDDTSDSKKADPVLDELRKMSNDFTSPTLKAAAANLVIGFMTSSKAGGMKALTSKLEELKTKATALNKQQHELAESITKFCSQ